jgi:hypothetical protein
MPAKKPERNFESTFFFTYIAYIDCVEKKSKAFFWQSWHTLQQREET